MQYLKYLPPKKTENSYHYYPFDEFAPFLPDIYQTVIWGYVSLDSNLTKQTHIHQNLAKIIHNVHTDP